jgi:hypothetical protein
MTGVMTGTTEGTGMTGMTGMTGIEDRMNEDKIHNRKE